MPYEWMRRTAAANSVSYTNFTYDLAGRLTGNTQTTGGAASHGFSYSYYNDDSLASLAYPSQRSVVNCYDAYGRVSWVSKDRLMSDCTSGGGLSKSAYAAVSSYAPTGAIQQMTLGNGLVEAEAYNDRLQPVSMGLGVSAANPNAWSVGYGYGTPNNGNMQSQTIAAAGNTFSQSYTYDGLNRCRLYKSAELECIRVVTYDNGMLSF